MGKTRLTRPTVVAGLAVRCGMVDFGRMLAKVFGVRVEMTRDVESASLDLAMSS